jgi:hypothetical protein
MENDPIIRDRTVSFLVLAALLLISSAILLVGLRVLEGAIASADAASRPGLARMAWVFASLVGLNLILLSWAAARYAQFRRQRTRGHKPTPYVDAWAAAGERYQLSDADEQEEDEG